jgi:hypothetical protein
MHTRRLVRSHAAVSYVLINVNNKHYAAGQSKLTKQPLIYARPRQSMVHSLGFEPDNSTEDSNVKL